ncbi:type IV pili methyl-accepting chemotaxis transducer N-terminal domain-containing protein [Jannaschia seohaensis]|uniref:PilJ/NarX-like methyl-accepting chemotaxis transducer n=1 Tax=Jannaschia seohaensis TaxID=475081 RepID=A0A2Y9B7M8_9RHOB|nr:type IV pili methyl-accepting chemotaxis transducer N-terminal domain-containing protein [Jannaschia seohaensis]PWJ12506.1 PilJ/NarX-like methyl-accepting chemotaxis transducer [Jannaschia seohaensis]SSA50987.1 Type IV pili methyl-accepting chemotaxis transducer N-term [Jannaschia seohaensis]
MIPRILKRSARLSAATALALTLTLPLSANAQSLDMSNWANVDKIPKTEATVVPVQVQIKENGPERIDFAGKLRMLTQRIPASACNAAAGIGGRVAKGYLSASIGEIDRIMNALEFGDVFISIKTPETDRRVLRRIAQMNDLWEPVREEVLPIADLNAGDTTVEDIRTTAEKSPEMLEVTQALVGELIGEYADPSRLLATDAVGLDILGRQRMMPQLISKSTCMIAEGISTDIAQEELKSSIDLFELSLQALAYGMPEAGVRPPATEEIRNGLLDVMARWNDVRPTIDALRATGTLSTEEREFVYEEMNDLTAMMNEVSRIYAQASTQSL